MNKSNGVSTGVLVVALLLLAAGPLMAEEASQQRPMAYVVCGDGNFQDNRVYRVDLLAGEVKGVSDPLDWMGKPQHLSFDGRAPRHAQSLLRPGSFPFVYCQHAWKGRRLLACHRCAR